MNVKRKALRLRKHCQFNEMFSLLLSTGEKGNNVLNEFLDNDEALANRYIDWHVENILKLLQNPGFGFVNTSFQLEHPEKYRLFKFLNKGLRAGGMVSGEELRKVLLDINGANNLERFELENPELFIRNEVSVIDWLRAAIKQSIIIKEALLFA